MAQDPIRQLLDLVAVHGFYLSLLENVTGEAVPVPRGAAAAEREGTPVEQSISVLRRWLNILDMAISPPMFRDALRDTLDVAVAEALLRYYVLKTSHTDVDRDKCDFINTFLYRAWRKRSGKSEAPAEAVEIGPGETLAFEGEIYVMLGDVEPPELPQEHLQLAREFDHLLPEVDEFCHFDKVMDSGILGRVRDIKHSFGASFYHPHVLANTAVYNAFFGRKFDELFAKAASEIKSFAQTVQQSGGSMHTRLNDEVTVQQLAELQGDEIHHAEYGKAGAQLRKVADFKRVVDIKRKGRYTAALPMDSLAVTGAVSGRGANAVPISPGAPSAKQSAEPGAETHGGQGLRPSPVDTHRGPTSANKQEDNKVQGTMDMIRHFILAADKSFANVVPLRNARVLVTPAEVDAFRNPYLDEKSFRADYAELMRRMVATIATIMIELEDYKLKRTSAYLWKQHADSLKYLLENTAKLTTEAKDFASVCERRGLADKVRMIEATSERLQRQAQEVAKVLQS
ncbi:MAG: hypothetical protein M3P27_09880 [Acidobacteriota bacterium]|nr:hypothetical protein [Acidobacteriota bacterium]